MTLKTRWFAALAGVTAVGAVLVSGTQGVKAADHLDPPDRTGSTATTADAAADIADIYAWHTEGGNLVLALTFAGPMAPSADQEGTYDRDVLYTLHLDTDANFTNADTNPITVRFGLKEDRSGWQVQVTGVPGSETAITGDVEETITSGDIKVFAGLREDPFFFDLQGFQETVMTGDVAFDSTRDFFAGKNGTAFVVEFPIADLGEETPGLISVWASTARISE